MSLKKRIIHLLNKTGTNMTMQEIYTHFPNEIKTTVRGRVYDGLGKGITRLGKGLYISEDVIIEHGNSLEIIDRMVEEGDTFDFIFLDIPYRSDGQKGGNRNLFNCDTINPDQFGIFIRKLETLLKTDTSPLLFMFTSGKESSKHHDRYISKFDTTGLKRCEKVGTYTKLWKTGNRMNMGKYLMPHENIYIYSRSGSVHNIDRWQMEFELTPDFKEYPTSKPYVMIRTFVEQATKIGDWVLDTFGGSGKILRACRELKRKCHIIDSSQIAIHHHILPIMQEINF